MSDEKDVVSFGGEAGQPDASQGASQPKDQPQYVTRDQMDAVIEQVRRDTQSLVDKNVGRMSQHLSKLNEAIERVRATGLEISPEQEKEMRTRALEKALSEADAPPSQEKQDTPAAAQPTTQPALDPVSVVALNVMKGILGGDVVTNADPEAELVDKDTKNPDEFLASVRKAAEAKKARLEGEKLELAQARSPVLGGGGASSTGLADQYKNEMLAARGKGMDAIRAIKEKWRKKGVDVDSVSLYK
jgi:hypothetical protein